jgi:hypothetical protein
MMPNAPLRLATRPISPVSCQLVLCQSKLKGRKGRRWKIRRQVASLMGNGQVAPAKADVLRTTWKSKVWHGSRRNEEAGGAGGGAGSVGPVRTRRRRNRPRGEGVFTSWANSLRREIELPLTR